MATMHPDAVEFLRYFPPGILFTSSRCPDCRQWTYVDLMAGDLICYRHEDGERHFTLRERIDARATRVMQEAPRGATVYHKPYHAR